MKKAIFVILFFLFECVLFAQYQNLEELSTGVIETTSILTDSDKNVIGYSILYNKGLVNDSKEQEFEYVILDKKLHKVTNGTYQIPYTQKLVPRVQSVIFNNQQVYVVTRIIDQKYGISSGQLVTSIDLKSNQFKHFLYTYGTIYKPEEINFNELAKMDFRGNYGISDYVFIHAEKDQVYYVATQFNRINPEEIPLYYITFYDSDFNKKYEYYLDGEKRKNYYSFLGKSIKNHQTVIWQRKNTFKDGLKMGVDRLLTYDINTSELLSNIVYNSNLVNGQEYYDPNVEVFDQKMFVVGEIKMAPEQYVGKYQSKPSLGIKRTIYDEKGEVLVDNKVYYQDIFAELKFKNGRDSKGYKFLMTEHFNFNDHSFTILLAKEKGDGNFVATKTTDYILVNFDPKGNYTHHLVLEKSKEYFDTYLFSQENKEENEVLFFYQEKLKEDGKRNYYLVVNKLKDGQLSQLKMPFKTESTSLRFSKAEYGNILITEYNQEDKEVSIRLEKLNL